MSLRKNARAALGVLSAVAALSAVVIPAAMADQAVPAAKDPAPADAHPKLTLFAAAPAGYTHPDDLTRLGNVLYAAYQNNAAADGSPAGSKSDIVGFDIKTGKAVYHWVLPGRVDGLTADPSNHRLLATANEDLNSSLYTITPTSGSEAVKHYQYSPSPAETGTDGTNGGTDALSVAPNGTIYVAHSNPDTSLPGANNTAATYTLKLSGSTANLTRLYGVNDTATVINPAKGAPAKANLGLTDPDSNCWIPGPDGGTLIQDAQADSKLVYVSHLDAEHPTVSQLNLVNAKTPSKGAATPQLDDIERVTGDGTLFVVDSAAGKIYKADTEGVHPGTLFASQPAPKDGDLPNDPALAVIDQRTGVVTHLNVNVTLQSPKGLLFVPGNNH